jgi:hypothetical protein
VVNFGKIIDSRAIRSPKTGKIEEVDMVNYLITMMLCGVITVLLSLSFNLNSEEQLLNLIGLMVANILYELKKEK